MAVSLVLATQHENRWVSSIHVSRQARVLSSQSRRRRQEGPWGSPANLVELASRLGEELREELRCLHTPEV